MEPLVDETGANNARSTETSRLVGSGSSSRPSYLNLVSNICALVLLGIIMFCCFKNGVTLFSFHPIFMTLGWLLCMTTAVNAITPGDLATEWMPIRLRSARHWVLQLVTGIIVLIGFLIILSNKIINDKPHFVSLHSKFGLASFILMFGTMFGGLGALYSLKLKNILAPLYTKLIHASAGIITFTLGIVTIILGLFSAWWSFGEILRYSSMFLVLIVTMCTVLRPTLKIFFRLKERLHNVN